MRDRSHPPKIHETAIVYPSVILGEGCDVGAFVIVGHLARNDKPGNSETRIGDGATIRSHTIIYTGNLIGRNFQTGHGVMVREENEIGDDVSVGTNSVVEHHVKVGDRVRLHSNVFIPEYSVLENGCWIGPNVVFTNAKYPQSPRVKEELIGPYVEAGAIISANATVLPGVRIGKNSLVGAGAVVTKNVPEGAVVVGNPGRIIKSRSELPYMEETE